MRIRTSLCLLACCAALAACTAAPPKGPDATVTTPAVGRPPAPASAQAAWSSEAFTPYAGIGFGYGNNGLAPGEGALSLAATCMTAAGYPGAGAAYDQEWVGLGPEFLSSAGGTSPWGAFGYLGAADAQQHGFQQFPPPPPPVVLAGAAEQAAAGKCLTILQDFNNAVDTGPLAGIGTLSDDIATDVQQDAAVKAATRAWSACMARNGYSVDQPQALYNQETQAMYGKGGNLGAPVSASAQRAQLAAAVTDADCTQSSDLAGIYFAVQASYEKQLVTANQQALAATVRSYRAAFKKELTKLTALLRTAKAQPFSNAG